MNHKTQSSSWTISKRVQPGWLWKKLSLIYSLRKLIKAFGVREFYFYRLLTYFETLVLSIRFQGISRFLWINSTYSATSSSSMSSWSLLLILPCRIKNRDKCTMKPIKLKAQGHSFVHGHQGLGLGRTLAICSHVIYFWRLCKSKIF